jgi:hypothetical protein
MRAFIYRVLYYTGLRHNEANTLTCADFLLDKAEPVILLPGSLVKNRRFNLVEIAQPILDELRAFIAPRKSTDRPFHGYIPKIATLKKDLSRVGIVFENERGRFDLHAFRKTLGTHLAMAGEPPQKTQRILRHESLSQTMKFYTDVSLIGGRESLAKLPVLVKKKAGVEDTSGGSAQTGISGPLETHCDNAGYEEQIPQPLENEPSELVLAPVGTGGEMVGLERFELGSDKSFSVAPTSAISRPKDSSSRDCDLSFTYPLLTLRVTEGTGKSILTVPPTGVSAFGSCGVSFLPLRAGSLANDSRLLMSETSV